MVRERKQPLIHMSKVTPKPLEIHGGRIFYMVTCSACQTVCDDVDAYRRHVLSMDDEAHSALVVSEVMDG